MKTVMNVDAFVAAATDPDLMTQAERLRKWKRSGTSMLDLRAAEDFETHRFEGAVNIPFDDLDGRLHELPPRGTPMAVLLKQPDGPDDEATFEAQLRVFAADFKSIPWKVTRVFVPNPGVNRPDKASPVVLFSEIAPAADVSVASGTVSAHQRGRLWEPSASVARWLPLIERRSADVSEDPSPRAAGVLVDLGCGAGRDAVFAAMRGWNVLALDSDAKGLARCAALAAMHGVSGNVKGSRVDLRKRTPRELVDMARAESWNTSRARKLSGEPITDGYGAARFPARITFLAVRYMNRGLIRALPAILPVGSFVCWFHFERGAERSRVGRPNKAKDLLEKGELSESFLGSKRGWKVLCDSQTVLPDGRPVSEFVAERVEHGEEERGDREPTAGG